MILKDDRLRFSIVGGVIVTVLVITVLSFIGWKLYGRSGQMGRQVSSVATNDVSSGNQPGKAVVSSTTMTNQPTYLNVKEWGVRMPLPDSIKDAYYVAPIGITNDADGLPSGIILGVNSLNRSCGTVSADTHGYGHLLGEIVRALPTDKDPVSGKLYTQLYPNGASIGSYYYGYISTIKSKTCTSQATRQSVDSAFAAAVKGTVKATAAQ